MKNVLIWAVLMGLTTAGCVSKAKSNLQAQQAFIAGQQQAMAQQPSQQPMVFVKGEVRTPKVPWTEDLTLSQAIVTAGYTGFLDPKIITVTRQGEVFRISPASLANGLNNPLLEPADVIELSR